MLTEIKNSTLYFDGCDTTELAQKFGTPLYVFSVTDMEHKLREITECFVKPYPKNRIAYAAKAFCCEAMAKLIEKEGACIDVVSGGELHTVIKAGFPAARIEFNGNNKSRTELELAVGYGVGRIIIDGLQELTMLESVCREKGKTVKALMRVTPGVKSDTHDYIVTGKKDSKFGVPLDDEIILPYIKEVIDSPYVELLGFHFHVGSQLFDHQSHIQALDIVLKLMRKVTAKYGYTFQEVNIGGGFGIQYTNEVRKSYAYFLEPLMDLIKDYAAETGGDMLAVVAEPGRSIVGEAGITLYTVGTSKDIPGVRKYVAIDGGMGDNIRPSLYEAKYTALLANRADEPAGSPVTICGKCCESGDIIVRDEPLPEQPRAGDIMAVLSTGAYGYSMASNYNRNPVPGVLFVKDGKAQWAIKHQTWDDIVRNDVIPEMLT